MTKTKTRTLTRVFLLKGFDRDAVPGDPTQDYVAATEAVWHALLNAAVTSKYADDGPAEHEGRPGYLVTGVGPRDIIRTLWPRLVSESPASARRFMNAARTHLVRSGNAACLRQERKHATGQWWVAAEWVAPETRRRTHALDAGESVTDHAAESPAVDLPSEGPEISDQEIVMGISNLISVLIDRHTRELREENKRLQERLDAISHVIGAP
jgi:hypothetical protein